MNAPTARLRYGMGLLSSTELGPVVGDNCRNGVFCKAMFFPRIDLLTYIKEIFLLQAARLLSVFFFRCGADSVAHRMHPTP